MKTFISTLLLLLGLSSVASAAENKSAAQQLNSFTQHFATFAKEYPQEKVYLHFDNTSYYLGETMWFKAYVVRAEENEISLLSKVLYVELVSQEGYVVETKKIKIEKGQCRGEFKLPTTNYAGFYEVRAYTRYMLNWGADNIFSRVFPVYDIPKSEGEYQRKITERAPSQRIPHVRKESGQKETLALSFFPEGGNLVSGVKSKVAFKATSKDGGNAIVSGNIYDTQGKSVAEMETSYQGMGYFEFTPGTGGYTAKVLFNNKEYSFELPQVLPSGCTLSVDNKDDENLMVYVRKGACNENDTLGLSLSCRGKIIGSEEVYMKGRDVEVLSFPKSKLPTGVIRVSLFNVSGEVLGERLFFINHHDYLKINVTQDKSYYRPFEKVQMDFQLTDSEDEPAETTFSVAVRDDATTSSNPYTDNALTNLLLSSEVKGYIENPGYYFASDDQSRKQALDLLLLTQGWSRYVWKQMAGVVPFEVKNKIENGLQIDGSVLSFWLRKKLENVKVTMILLADSTSQHNKMITDKEGEFQFPLNDFYGKAKLILQTKVKEKRNEKNICLDRNFFPILKCYTYAEQNIQEYIKAVRDTIIAPEDTMGISSLFNKKLPMDKKNHLLREVLVKGKRKASISGPLKVSLKYMVEQDMDRRRDEGEWMPATLYTYLEFASKYFSNGKYKGKRVVNIYGDSFLSGTERNPVTSEDDELRSTDESKDRNTQSEFESNTSDKDKGMQPVTVNQNMSVPPVYIPNPIDKIESVSIVEDPASVLRIAPQIANPENSVVFLIQYKKKYIKEPIGIRNTYFEGYSRVKEFYSPQYDKVLLPNETDCRRTLYWNPDVKTDAGGKASIRFFNNSSCRSMNVSAETVTEEGVIGTMCK